jgi:hypothetical protein
MLDVFPVKTPKQFVYPPLNFWNPILRATSMMIYQLAADLHECLDCSWTAVARRGPDHLLPWCVFGDEGVAQLCLNGTGPVLAHFDPGVLELGSAGLPKMICAILVNGKIVGALAFGPKPGRHAFSIEEKNLVLQFADHISKLIEKDSRIRGATGLRASA